jgi:hypothetical protein
MIILLQVPSQGPLPATYADKQLSRALERSVAALEKALLRSDLVEIVRLLKTDRDAPSPNYETPNGWTPLRKAAWLGDVKSARLLLGPGVACDINYLNKYRTTALMTAARRGSVACVLLLLERGAEFRCCDAFGMTPRMYAAGGGRGRGRGGSVTTTTYNGQEEEAATDDDDDDALCRRVLVEAEAHNDGATALKLHAGRVEEARKQDKALAAQEERRHALRAEYARFKATTTQGKREGGKPLGGTTTIAPPSEPAGGLLLLSRSLSTPSSLATTSGTATTTTTRESIVPFLDRTEESHDAGSCDSRRLGTLLTASHASLSALLTTRFKTDHHLPATRRDSLQEAAHKVHDRRQVLAHILAKRRGGLASTYGSLHDGETPQKSPPRLGRGRAENDHAEPEDDDIVQVRDPLTGAVHVLKESKKHVRKEILPCQRCQRLKARNRCVQCRLLLCDRCWVDIHGTQEKSGCSKHQAVLIVANDIVVQIDVPNKNKRYLARDSASDRAGEGGSSNSVAHGPHSKVGPSFTTAAIAAHGAGKFQHRRGGRDAAEVSTALAPPHAHSKALTKAEYVGAKQAHLKSSTAGLRIYCRHPCRSRAFYTRVGAHTPPHTLHSLCF